jgi:hypothetical protein
MALRIVAADPDPAVVTLPWSTPLEEWDDELVVPLPRGLSRHVVRMVRLDQRIYAVKETSEELASREYELLRRLQARGLATVLPQGVVAGRVDAHGEELPSALLTRYLRFSLSYRTLFSQGLSRADNLPRLVDALVVLLVRLHLAGFYWGDVSLSNVLFRRNAGEFSAYLVDAETGELTGTLSDRLREHDVEVGCENVFAEIMDLQAGGELDEAIEPESLVDRIQQRYDDLWAELTREEEFGADEMWRIERRIERLNDLGFDVDELDITTAHDGERMRIRPKVVALGHHARELEQLTGLRVEDNQARRLLNDLAAYTAHHGLGDEDRDVVAQEWLNEVYRPIARMVPLEARGKLEPAEVFHEILVHRWFLSEQAGREVDIFDTARSYVDTVLAARPVEALDATQRDV